MVASPFWNVAFGGVLSRNPFPGLRGGGHDCLPFGWPALLQLTETADPTEQAIQLINRDRFFEFRTGSVEQRLLAPICRNCFEGGVCIDAALFVESRPAVGENGEANHADHKQDQRQSTATDEEFLHA